MKHEEVTISVDGTTWTMPRDEFSRQYSICVYAIHRHEARCPNVRRFVLWAGAVSGFAGVMGFFVGLFTKG